MIPQNYKKLGAFGSEVTISFADGFVDGKVLQKATALKSWMAIDKQWKRKVISPLPPDIWASQLAEEVDQCEATATGVL